MMISFLTSCAAFGRTGFSTVEKARRASYILVMERQPIFRFREYVSGLPKGLRSATGFRCTTLPIQFYRSFFTQNHVCRPAASLRRNVAAIAFASCHLLIKGLSGTSAAAAAAYRPVVCRNASRIYIQRARSPFQHIGRNCFLAEGLAGNTDRLIGGFERGSPALPLLRRISGRERIYFNGAVRGLLIYIISLSTSLISVLTEADNLTLSPCRLINRLAHVHRFGKAAAIQPLHLIAHLEPRILDGAGHAVVSAGSAERQQMRARFQHPEDFAPQFHAVRNAALVPCLAHEAQLVRRIGYAGVQAVVRQRLQQFQAVAAAYVYSQRSLLYLTSKSTRTIFFA